MDASHPTAALAAFDGLVEALATLERLAAHGQACAHWKRTHHRGEAPRMFLGVGMLDNISNTDTLSLSPVPFDTASAHTRLAWNGALAQSSACGDALWEALDRHPTLGPILHDRHQGENPNGLTRGPHLHVQVTQQGTDTPLVSIGVGSLAPPPALGGPAVPLAEARAHLARALTTTAGTPRTVFAFEPCDSAFAIGIALGPCIDQGGAAAHLLGLMAVRNVPRWRLATHIPDSLPASPALVHHLSHTVQAQRDQARDAWNTLETERQHLHRHAFQGFTDEDSISMRWTIGDARMAVWRNAKPISPQHAGQKAFETLALPFLQGVHRWMEHHAPWLASRPSVQGTTLGHKPARLVLSWGSTEPLPTVRVTQQAHQHGHPLACLEHAPDRAVATKDLPQRPYSILDAGGTLGHLWCHDADTARAWYALKKAQVSLSGSAMYLLDTVPDHQA